MVNGILIDILANIPYFLLVIFEADIKSMLLQRLLASIN